MSYSSICTSFTYTGSDTNIDFYKKAPITWNSIEIECSDDWRVVGDSDPFPEYIDVRVSISVTNNNTDAIVWDSTKPKFSLLGDDSVYYDTPHYGDTIDMGFWASEQDITIEAGKTVDLSHTFRINWSQNINGLDPTISGYSEFGYTHFLKLIKGNTARFFLGIPQVNSWSGYKRVNATFNFVYPQNVYDYRAWPHCPAGYELYEDPMQYGVNITPNSYNNFGPTVTDFDGTVLASVVHAQGLATQANNPDIRIKCEELGDTPLPLSYPTNYSASTYNKYTFAEGCKELFVNYFKKNGITTATTFTFTIQFRNPFKFNSLPIGAMIILPDNTVYEVTKTGDSDKYYQESWEDFEVIQVPFAMTPNSSVSYFRATASSIQTIVDTENGGQALGCLYAPYTKPKTTISYTAGWGVNTITVNPSGDAWQNFPSFSVQVPSASGNTVTGTIEVEQPDFYTYALFNNDEVQKELSTAIEITPNVGSKITALDYTRYVFKYLPLDIKSYDGYRADSTGAKTVNGDYIGILSSFVSTQMREPGVRIYNPITKNMKVTTLSDGAIVFDGAIDLESDVSWVSTSSYELGAETSYFVEVTISDKFTSVNFRFNIGTKVAYLEFGDDAKHLAIGKYCEKEGFEIQFPVFFAKQVVVLPKGKEKFYEIASVIPYEDTYNIGCSNVQEVLDWLNRRLS